MQSVLRKLLLAAAVVGAPRVLLAQQAGEAKNEVGVAFGLSRMPDALRTQCGDDVMKGNAGGGTELGASWLRRIGHGLAVQADTRATAQLGMLGCDISLPAIDTAYAASLNRRVFATSTVRLAVETPRSMPLFRLSAGAGVAWGRQTLPLGVMALTWSTRGQYTRLFVEGERLQTRVVAMERHFWPSPPREVGVSRRIVVYPVEHTVRIGLSQRL